MVSLFFLFLYPIYYIIKIQIIIGILHFTFFIFIFVVFYLLLKTEYSFQCKELPANTSKLGLYSFLNVFLFVPKAKAFIYFYNFMFYIFNKDKNVSNNNSNYTNIIISYTIFLTIFLIIYMLKFSLLIIFGYSYLTLYVCSQFTLKIFNIFTYKFVSKKAMYQTILINCFMDNVDTVGYANELALIISKDEIIFNMKSFLTNFFFKVKNPELLKKAYEVNKGVYNTAYINNHYNFNISSQRYPDKCIAKNLTSSSKIKVIDENNVITNIKCPHSYKPNLKGVNKENFITPAYIMNKNNVVVGELDKNSLVKMNEFSKQIQASFLCEKDKRLILYEDYQWYDNSNNPTLKEFCKEYKLPLDEKIEFLQQ